MGASRVPSVRSAQLSAIFVSAWSSRTYGPGEWTNRADGELSAPTSAVIHAFQVPPRFAEPASPWHSASAPATPSRSPLYSWLLTNTRRDSLSHELLQP